VDPIVQRYDFTHLDVTDRRTTPSGGIVVKARISRTGILEYTNDDGSTRRELRLEADVFDKAALDSFAGATVTELHPSEMVTPLNWRKVTLGHLAGAPVRDGEFAASDIQIEDAAGIRKAESGELKELSCGYQCKVDNTPGVHPTYGRYDARQYEIRGNHVALGPTGWGRSGSKVALRLDAGAAASGLEPGAYVRGMTEPLAKETPPAPATTTTTTNTDADRLRGENAALTAANARLTADAAARDAAAVASQTSEREDAAIEERVALIDAAKPHLDEKGKPWSHKGKTADAIRREVLAKIEPGLDLPDREDAGADAYVRGAFEMAVPRAARATTALRRTTLASAKNDRAVTTLPTPRERKDAGTEGSGDMIGDAADASVKRMKAASKPPQTGNAAGGGR
jgi:uncharacterized protein